MDARWVAKGLKFLQAENEDSDQTVWMHRLIRCSLFAHTILYLIVDTGLYDVTVSQDNCKTQKHLQ